jgi:hypothetical protein
MELGPCLSPDVAIRSPKLAKDYRLGQPLPNQLPKPPAAHLEAIYLYLSGFPREFIQDFIPVFEVSSTVLLTRSPLPFGRSTRMCKARFQRSFGARITPKRFSEQNLDSVFFLILVLLEHVCCPLKNMEGNPYIFPDFDFFFRTSIFDLLHLSFLTRNMRIFGSIEVGIHRNQFGRSRGLLRMQDALKV